VHGDTGRSASVVCQHKARASVYSHRVSLRPNRVKQTEALGNNTGTQPLLKLNHITTRYCHTPPSPTDPLDRQCRFVADPRWAVSRNKAAREQQTTRHTQDPCSQTVASHYSRQQKATGPYMGRPTGTSPATLLITRIERHNAQQRVEVKALNFTRNPGRQAHTTRRCSSNDATIMLTCSVA